MNFKQRLYLVVLGCLLIVAKMITMSDPGLRSPASMPPSYFISQVKPIFDNRCVACHSCEGAPCQLKLDSFEGVDRGATTAYPKAVKLKEQPMTRIFKDSKTTQGWREKGFWPIINRDEGLTAEQRLQRSLLYQYVMQGRRQYHSGNLKELPPREFKECVKDSDEFISDMKDKEHRNRGMPFGLIPLPDEELKVIETWIAMGAPGPTAEEQKQMKTASHRGQIDDWEKFLNGKDARSAWTAKYLYEHLFLAHFHFDDNPGEFFELQRSKPDVPYGTSDEIVTKFPYNDPREPFEYRFNKVHSTIAHKVHIVYPVNKKTLKRLKELFLGTSWGDQPITPVSYVEINPFYNFEQIPAKIRYLFMIENSRLIMDFFTRGPVCSGGAMATWVIQDHSWAFFEHPDYDISVNDPNYFKAVKGNLVIPVMDNETHLWNYYMNKTEKFESIHATLLHQKYPQGRGLEHIWDGDGSNPNALLTLYRHAGYSVSVHHGQVGEVPKTFGLINYAIFERIYYDLVAGFNIYGSFNHKINSRLMITQLRRELEDNFLSLLPPELRREQRKKWYDDRKEMAKSYHFTENKSLIKIENRPDAAKELAVKIIDERLKKVAGPVDPLSGHERSTAKLNFLEEQLSSISGVTGVGAEFFPEISYFAFREQNGKILYYTVIRNRAHHSVHYLFNEEDLIDEANTTLNILKDFPLSFPIQFFMVDTNNIEDFFKMIKKIRTLEDYQAMEKKYGIAKNDQHFWKYYDHLNQHIMKLDPVTGGVLDLNRYGLHHFPDFKF